MPTDVQLEKLTLRLLCGGSSQGPVRDDLVPLLRHYRWQHLLHQILFSALAAIPSDDPETLRQLLPAKLTRMGFPDIEWDEIFERPSLSREEAIAMVRHMTAGP